MGSRHVDKRGCVRALTKPGVIACNDLIAIGFIRTVLKAGCRMPEDVQGIGFDNILMRPY